MSLEEHYGEDEIPSSPRCPRYGLGLSRSEERSISDGSSVREAIQSPPWAVIDLLAMLGGVYEQASEPESRNRYAGMSRCAIRYELMESRYGSVDE